MAEVTLDLDAIEQRTKWFMDVSRDRTWFPRMVVQSLFNDVKVLLAEVRGLSNLAKEREAGAEALRAERDEAARVRDELADQVLALESERDETRGVREAASLLGERWAAAHRRAESLDEQLRRVTQERDAARRALTKVTAEKQTAERALERAREELRGVAGDAVEAIQHWGSYASECFQQKWNLAGDIDRFKRIVEELNSQVSANEPHGGSNEPKGE